MQRSRDVDMDGSDDSKNPSHRPKVGHRKSRNGCHKCKSRRVKCDETRPICNNCNRLGLSCLWPQPTKPTPYRIVTRGGSREALPRPGGSGRGHGGRAPSPDSNQDSAAAGNSAGIQKRFGIQQPDYLDEPLFGSSVIDSANDAEMVLPESRSRRMLEHRLMQHYIFNMSKPFPVSAGPNWSDLFMKKVPQLALRYENLLYTLLANAAAHLFRSEPHDMELLAARRSYLVAAVREQRKMVDKITSTEAADSFNVEWADALCLASLLLVVHSWTALQDRPLEPYSPPLEWLQMGRGAGVLIWMSIDAMMKSGKSKDGETSSMMTVANSYPRFGADESYFGADMRRNFTGVLTQKLPSGDDWGDDETRETYEKALSYVGSIQHAIDHGEPVYALYRRIQCFALIIPRRFSEFLEERRPRALVIMAHFFATVGQLPCVWWIGDGEGGREPTAKREIRAISKVLPSEWQAQLVWPLDMLGLR